MSPTPELSQQHRQSLAITPQFQQSLKVLQCSALELQELVQGELEVNPVLELDNDDRGEHGHLDANEQGGSDELEGVERYLVDEARPSRSDFEGPTGKAGVDEQGAQHDTLVYYLSRQLCEVDAEAAHRTAAAHIIGNLSSDGLLEIPLEEIARLAKVLPYEAIAGLEIVQTMEPVGVGARSVQEALLLQLEQLGRHEGLAGSLVRKHLALLGARKFAEIAQREGVSIGAVRDALAVIRTLRPFPARGFFLEDSRGVVPEISIEKVGQGYLVLPQDELMPRIRISSYYRALARDPGSLDGQARGYLNARIRGATWLMRCIHQRETTIRKIAEVVARTQRHFFDCGIEALRPMVLRDVAGELGLHESTISRAIAAKYISTPQGIFEFRFFFTPRIKTARGEISTTTIRERLKALIRSEDPAAPLSDQALAELLAQTEVRISRRTVTKYRESMGIPPSGLRKECGIGSTEIDAA